VFPLAFRYGIRKFHHGNTISHGGKPAGQIDQSLGNGVADIKAGEEIVQADRFRARKAAERTARARHGALCRWRP